MFMMKGLTMLFISLAIGYVVCILARKQEGILKTVGYTIGIGILALSLLCAAAESMSQCFMSGKSMCGFKSMKCFHDGDKFMKAHKK